MTVLPRKFQVISLTEAAAARVREIVERSEGEAIGLRVGVKNGGCAGMSYSFDIARDTRPGDEVVEDKGARVVVDGKAVLFLFGTTLDFRTDKFSSTFVFENPNQTSACGCGESVAIKPVAADRIASAG
jgi:iron-sulfur cluster assembly protein